MRLHAAALLLVMPAAAMAQSVSMSGSLGDKALLVIDGAPRTVAAGATVGGVKVVSVSGSQTVVEVGGKRQTLLLGGAQVNLGGTASAGSGTKIVLAAGPGGHFVTNGPRLPGGVARSDVLTFHSPGAVTGYLAAPVSLKLCGPSGSLQ